jgi:predicted ATPase with chaperone activity
LDDYVESVRSQSITASGVRLPQLQQAFDDLSLSALVISQIGQAINSGSGLFLYGPPGNGKTSIAERFARVLGDYIWIPRTITVTGDMIRLYDPSVHEAIPPEHWKQHFGEAALDQRWVPVRRPTILVGAELTWEHLDVCFNPATGIQEAPLQLKSNGGVLVLDDFGRQRIRGTDLINRWTVPLEKRQDFLNLPSGRQIQVPLGQLLVFCTNSEPNKVVDEAFLRRIPYKVELADPTEAAFKALMQRAAPQFGFQYNEEAVNHLLQNHYRAAQRPMRYSHPHELLRQVRVLNQLHDVPLELTAKAFDLAVRNYFTGL